MRPARCDGNLPSKCDAESGPRRTLLASSDRHGDPIRGAENRTATGATAAPDRAASGAPWRDAPGRVSQASRVSQSAFAARLGVSFPRINEIVRGKRAVTPDTALRLARVTRMSADFWLGLQSDWDLWHALRSKEAEQIAKLTPLPRAG
jgi:addiction module HigA family antidote